MMPPLLGHRTFLAVGAGPPACTSHDGTDDWSSLVAPFNVPAPAPRDDLEALAYVLVWLSRGDLPWEGAKSPAELASIKRSTSNSELCRGCPGELLVLTHALHFTALHCTAQPYTHA